MRRDLAALAGATGGTLHGADVAFGSVSTDTRTIEPGSLYVALRGERFDGHDFVPEALARGAAGALVSRVASVSLPQVVVADVLEGLTTFAAAWRRGFAGPVVGITGSNGKTTVKEMTGAILGRLGPCLVTRGNLNNHIGVPLTLCRLEPGHRTAVIEMGANHQGEIAALAATARPDVGLVINAGPAHLEGFGGLDGVAKGKGEMFAALGTAQTAVLNADDRYCDYWRGVAAGAGRILTFGMRAAADFCASGVLSRATEGGFVTEFDLDCALGRRRVQIALAGEHNVMNALAAAAAASAAGADLDAIAEGLAGMRAVAGRLEFKALPGGARLVDDSYNANPGSVEAGLRALEAVGGERWLVLGEMRELGADSPELHARIGQLARAHGVSRLYAVGEEARYAVEAFGTGSTWFATVEDLIGQLGGQLAPGVTVLVKGSRSNRLERVAATLGAGGTGGH
jgi:UDP-N-acetylmuramoyl-tripeptide--D-alanyl-D-alanine ligase